MAVAVNAAATLVAHSHGNVGFLSSNASVTELATTSFKKYPATAPDLSQTENGEGSFLIVGDWGNPFNPGTYDGDANCWGPHWKCNGCGRTAPVECCTHGSQCYERDEVSQVTVADGMAAWSQKNVAQFVVNVGDNFYPRGLSSPDDPMWGYVFEERYKLLQVPWFSVMGNHDYGGFECYFDGTTFTHAAAQIAYDTEPDWQWPQEKQVRWVMPADHYKKTIKFGNVTIDLFMMDTNGWDEADGPLGCGQHSSVPGSVSCNDYITECKEKNGQLQAQNLDFITKEVPKSNATWKFIVGHHPFTSWGGNMLDFVVKHRVSAYFAGHNHGMEANWHGRNGSTGQHPETMPGHMFEMVNGAGGGSFPDGSFFDSRWGFTGVHLKKSGMEFEYVGDLGKNATVWIPHPCVHFAEPGEQSCTWGSGSWSKCAEGKQDREIWCVGGDVANCPEASKPEATQACVTPTSAPTPAPASAAGIGKFIGIGVGIVALFAAIAGGVWAMQRRKKVATQPVQRSLVNSNTGD